MTSKLTKNLYADSDDSDFVEEAYDEFDNDWDEDFEEHDWADEFDDEDFESIETKRFSAKHECYEDD